MHKYLVLCVRICWLSNISTP